MAAIFPRQRWINYILSLQLEHAPKEQVKEESKTYFETIEKWRFDTTFPQKIELTANVAELARNCILLVKAILLDPHKVTVVVEDNNKTEAERKAEREESRQKRAFIIGTAVFLGAIGFTGYHLKSFKRQNKIYNSSLEILRRAQELPKTPMKNQIIHLFNLQRKIEKIRTFKERGYAITVLGLTCGSGALFAYGLGIMKAMKMGYFLLIASTAVGVFNCAYHWKDAQKIERLQTEILGNGTHKGLADSILEQLRSNYTSEMELDPSRAPAQASAPALSLPSAALPVFASASQSASPPFSAGASYFSDIPVPSAPPLWPASKLTHPILTTYNAAKEPPPSFLSPHSGEVDD